MRIAVIGTGIAGMTAAYLLADEHDLTVFEADDYIGGHTHTVEVVEGDRRIPVDTGFIVYNDWTYPNFIKLLDRLGVATQPSDMSFSVQDERSGLEYNGNSLTTLFAQRRNLFNPRFYRMLRDILRFYRQSRQLADDPAADNLTIGEYVRRGRYSREFIEQHLVPIGASIWSADPQQFDAFPARYLVRFFLNHGMLNVFKRPRWRVIAGGSRSYVDRLTAPYADRILLRTPVQSIRRFADHVEVATSHDPSQRFDAVIIATHSDQALQLLADPTPLEREILTPLTYQPNETVLHTDTRMLPANRRCWASWNYHIPAAETRSATITYNMNLLQTLDTRETYCVTLNRTAAIAPERILARFTYHHPTYSVASVHAQRRHDELNAVNRTYFCGAYWGFGFHEDGVNSALTVARHFGRGL